MDQPLVVGCTYRATGDRVWKAITDKDQMREWYFNLAEFKPVVGFEFQFYGQDREGKAVLHACKVTEVITGQRLTYSWCYPEYGGESYVTFELKGDGDTTRVTLTHRGLDTFPVHNPSFARASFAEGWTYIIGTSLKGYVEK
jgi:uncharacterized protein YndB with AHSA1/START domain